MENQRTQPIEREGARVVCAVPGGHSLIVQIEPITPIISRKYKEIWAHGAHGNTVLFSACHDFFVAVSMEAFQTANAKWHEFQKHGYQGRWPVFNTTPARIQNVRILDGHPKNIPRRIGLRMAANRCRYCNACCAAKCRRLKATRASRTKSSD